MMFFFSFFGSSEKDGYICREISVDYENEKGMY